MAGTDTRVVLWAAAAVAACAAVAVAVGTSTGSRPAALSDEDIVNALAADRPPAVANPGPNASASPTGTTAVLDSPGGSVTAVCINGMASLQTWSPHPGYSVAQGASHDPGLSVSVQFQSDTHGAVTLVVTCVNGRPAVHQTIEQDTQGGTTTTTVPGTDPTTATNPAPAWTCTRPSLRTADRMAMAVSSDPS